MTVNLTAERHWVCPHCTFTDVTHSAVNETRMHSCKGMRLLSMPMVPDGLKCKVEANEREDFIGKELVRTDAEGRPFMNTKITRDDGDDCFVYAPTAQVGVSA